MSSFAYLTINFAFAFAHERSKYATKSDGLLHTTRDVLCIHM